MPFIILRVRLIAIEQLGIHTSRSGQSRLFNATWGWRKLDSAGFTAVQQSHRPQPRRPTTPPYSHPFGATALARYSHCHRSTIRHPLSLHQLGFHSPRSRSQLRLGSVCRIRSTLRNYSCEFLRGRRCSQLNFLASLRKQVSEDLSSQTGH